MTVIAIPAGVTPDKSAEYGLFGLISNLNASMSGPLSTITTSGTNTTLTTAQVGSAAIILTSGASGGFTITLPSTSSILTSLGPTIPTDGSFSFEMIVVNNNVGQTGTLTVGDASTTLSGTMTIATNTSRHFLFVVTAASTITITNLGSHTL